MQQIGLLLGKNKFIIQLGKVITNNLNIMEVILMCQITDQEKLKAKIDLWKEINDFVNKIENNYSLIITLLITVFGAIIAFFDGDLVSNEIFDYHFFILCLMPIGVSAVIAYLSYNFRWVAIARMYLTSLENEINKALGENIYVWNSNIVEDFVSKRNFANTKLLPVVNICFFGFSLIYFNYMMYMSSIPLGFKIIYTIITVLLFTISICPFAGNEKIRKNNYEFPKLK